MTDKHHHHKHPEDAHVHEHTHFHGKCCGKKHHCEKDAASTADKPVKEEAVSNEKKCCETAQEQKPIHIGQMEPIHIGQMELENLRRELAEYKNKYLLALADSENGRKRLQKEKQETIQFATQSLISEFLTPIDHMENALKFTQQMSEDVKHWAVGFQMILTQFKDVLSINGITPFDSEGKPFDPHRHEAIETVATADFAPGTVIEQTVRGYIMGDKVIRPARVKVAKAIEETK